MRRPITIVLAILVVVLLAISIFIYAAQDRTAPTIRFNNTITEWSEDQGKEALLEGVTAIDERDGDVTDSLRIRSIILSEDKTTITVIYVALDESNNVGTANRVITVK